MFEFFLNFFLMIAIEHNFRLPQKKQKKRRGISRVIKYLLMPSSREKLVSSAFARSLTLSSYIYYIKRTYKHYIT